ncbi:FecR domain-containing protein [Neorhodopirellula lusitana]|nr:FecR domain-containing protein [Neorhodopirellula lusitana]
MLHSSEEHLDDYVKYASQDAILLWNSESRSELKNHLPVRKSQIVANWLWQKSPLIAAVALVAIAIPWLSASSIQRELATIASTSDCLWGDGTLPTTQGEKLTSGRLRLVSGIAELQFPDTKVAIEGPADIELISATRCRLNGGSLVGTANGGGGKFVVETPCAEITDRGTKFGVAVTTSGDARLDVIEGEVDVKYHHSGKKLTLNSASRTFLSRDSLADPRHKRSHNERLAGPLSRNGIVHLPAIDAADVTSGDKQEGVDFPRPEHALLVKHSDDSPTWNRKAFLRFDLTNFSANGSTQVELRLEGVATGMGYMSLVPDSTFNLYGVSDPYNTEWNSSTLSRENFPGRQPKSYQLDPKKVELLGQFTVQKSNPVGQFSVIDPRLQGFVKSNSGKRVTLVLERLTPATSSSSYVHGFADLTHPTRSPPTLRLESEVSQSPHSPQD